MTPKPDLPREMPDRIIRRSLENPANLRDFLRQVVPDLADGFDYAHGTQPGREFFSDDWRLREADLLFEIPFRSQGTTQPALVCVLLEHQSDTDPLVPLRTLIVVVGYWEKRWRQWAEQARPRPEFRLPPILPIVLYTADRPWGSNRTIRDLLGEPSGFHAHAPAWEPVFWNLADRSPETLLAGGPWLQVLAVMRVTGEERSTFERIFREAVRHLAALQVSEEVRWSELLRVVVHYALWRRPDAERGALVDIAAEENPTRREEVRVMGRTIAEAYMAEGRLEQTKKVLLSILRVKFKVLPEDLVQRVNAATDLVRLESAVERAVESDQLDQLNF